MLKMHKSNHVNNGMTLVELLIVVTIVVLLVATSVPLMKPALAALAVLIFTFIWNDYFWAVVLTQGPSAQPVTAGITEFNSQFRAAYHLMSAGSIVAALPPVAMFFLMQKHFIAGLTLGAVK
mgnify:CR=1 FL=1